MLGWNYKVRDEKGVRMEYSNYKNLVASPEAHVEFLRIVDSHLEKATDRGDLCHRLNVAITVGGEPFSQARHLTALELNSDAWELESTADAVKVEIAALSQKIKAVDSGYDLPHFTASFEWMVRDLKERGVEVEGGLDFGEEEPERGVDFGPQMSP